MKKFLLICTLASLLFGCHYTEKLDKLSKENQKLVIETQAKDMAINDFAKSFDEIERNLSTIKEKEGLISVDMGKKLTAEQSSNAKERIVADLKEIDNLMISNRHIIASLDTKLHKSNVKLHDFSKLVQTLNAKIEEKDKEYVLLKADLSKSALAVQGLTEKNGELQRATDTQAAIINAQYNELNTAYYTTGTYKELKEHKVVVKEGSIVGIGGTKKLKNDFDKEVFQKIAIDKVNIIPLKANRVDIVTTHNPGSYRLEGANGKVDRLVITDPQSFWKTSKYLVVMVDKKERHDPFDHHELQ